MSTFFAELTGMLQDPFMQRSLFVAMLVGITAPIIGTFLVQRKLSLLGDGIGHIALTGVAAGWLAGASMGLTEQDALAIPGAIVAAIIGAIIIEVVSERGKTGADVALALLFYGGIAGGVLLIGMAGGTNANLMGYLFGSISTVTTLDLLLTLGLAAFIIVVGLGLRSLLFAVSYDAEFAKGSGLRVRLANLLIAVSAALTVTLSMRVVGLLLVSAVMIIPVAIAQQLTSSFRRTMYIAMAVGLIMTTVGLSITYWKAQSPGATIVIIAISMYLIVTVVNSFVTKLVRKRR